MNNTFSMRRICGYGRKHYVENARYYLYCTLASLIVLCGCAWYYSRMKPAAEGFRVVSLCLLMAFMYYVIRLGCRGHYERRSMTTAYTLPVTALEKYLFIWINSAVVPIAIFALLLWPVTSIAGIPDDNVFQHMVFPSWQMIYSVQAAILLACCWGKEYPMKIFLILLGAFILFYILYFKCWMSIGMSVRIPFSQIAVSMASDRATLDYPLREPVSERVAYLLIFGYWIVAGWVVGYFKFRERTLK